MRRMDAVDLLGATVRVQAGAVTEAVHQHCAPHGLTWPVDFASKGSSQVGGNIATNAGGVKVIRYGLTRQWVLGLEVVLARGEVLELNGALEKNNTGLDLRQLFIGSEGTLGVITEATLKLTRLPGSLDVLLFARARRRRRCSRSSARRAAGRSRSMAYEFFTERCLARVLRHRKLRPPFAAPCDYYVLLEVEGDGATERRRRAPSRSSSRGSRLFERGLATDGTLAQHARAGARALGAARGDQREPLRDRPAAQERHRPADRRARGLLQRARRASSRAAIPAGRSASSATSATATSTST